MPADPNGEVLYSNEPLRATRRVAEEPNHSLRPWRADQPAPDPDGPAVYDIDRDSVGPLLGFVPTAREHYNDDKRPRHLATWRGEPMKDTEALRVNWALDQLDPMLYPGNQIALTNSYAGSDPVLFSVDGEQFSLKRIKRVIEAAVFANGVVTAHGRVIIEGASSDFQGASYPAPDTHDGARAWLRDALSASQFAYAWQKAVDDERWAAALNGLGVGLSEREVAEFGFARMTLRRRSGKIDSRSAANQARAARRKELGLPANAILPEDGDSD